MELENRVAIVTGASSGIGRAIALALGKEAASVVIADVNLQGAQRVADEIKAAGSNALALSTDVSKEDQAKEMVRKTLDHFGAIDIMVNNAAYTSFEFKYFHESQSAEWEPEINITFKGVLYCCRAVVEHMIERRSGRIINITSDASKAAIPRQTIYSACKAAVAGFSRSLALELARYGIQVNCVAPGPVMTQAMRQRSSSWVEKVRASVPLGRIGEPEEIAEMVLFGASDRGRYITGQNYSVNGGVIMY